MPAVSSRFPTPVDLSDLDFDQVFERLVALIGSLYPWLDMQSRGEVARLHLEAMADTADHFHYYVNRLGRESRWGTALERTHLIAALKLVGYRPATATAATATERFTLAAVAAGSVTLPAGTFVSTPDVGTPVRFQLLAPLIIPAGTTVANALVEHSETIPETYLSDGKPFQRFRMSRSPYIDGTMRIVTSLGSWTEVTNFRDSLPGDRVFSTSIDSQDRVTPVFGNNRTGLIPSGSIQFVYKIGGGSAGKLPAGALTKLEGTFFDSTGSAVSISVTNPNKTDGGTDRETETDIKLNAPAQIEVQERAVSRTDYERIARSVPGVAFALMLTRNQDPAVLENEGFLFIVPTTGGDASLELLTAVATRFGDNVAVGGSGVYVSIPTGPTPKTCTFQLRVRSAAYKNVDLFVKAFLRKGARVDEVGPAIQAAYADYFAPMVSASSVGLGTDGQVPNPRLQFGYYLQDVDGTPTGHFPISDIETLVAGVSGVREIGDGPTDLTLNGLPRNVPITRYEFPRAGSVTYLLS